MSINIQSMPYKNMSVREYAAIHLRVPDSGDADLDAMIRQANRMKLMSSHFAAVEAAHQSASLADVVRQLGLANESDFVAAKHWPLYVASLTASAVDAMLAALEAKP